MMGGLYFRGKCSMTQDTQQTECPPRTEDSQRTGDSQRTQRKQSRKPYIKPAFRFELMSETSRLSCGKMRRSIM
jgi:hypothetical protein